MKQLWPSYEPEGDNASKAEGTHRMKNQQFSVLVSFRVCANFPNATILSVTFCVPGI